MSGNIYNNNLQNAIRDIQLNLNGNSSILGNNIIGTQANIQGSTINIGNITSSVYINGALYINGDLVFRSSNQYQNSLDMIEYFNQI